MVENMKGDILVDKLVNKLLQSSQGNASREVCVACLKWLCTLLQRSPEEMLQNDTLDRILKQIFETLRSPEDDVVAAALEVLSKIMVLEPERARSRDAPEDLFTSVTRRFLSLFEADWGVTERRRRETIRQLCGLVDARRFYVTVAHVIQDKDTPTAFAQLLVQTFSWILLTSQETRPLREELLRSKPGPQLFRQLLEPWFRNPVSALALCLWAQQYSLAAELTGRLATFEPTLDLLRQLDQLVHLLESPVFSQLRLQLLEPKKHPTLLKCLLGLAMLLPQAGAFGILRERIRVMQGGLLLEVAMPKPRLVSPSRPKEPDSQEVGELLDRFENMLKGIQ